jgi:hypothetical protein
VYSDKSGIEYGNQEYLLPERNILIVCWLTDEVLLIKFEI